MNRRKNIIFYNTFRNNDGVFKIVSIPRNKGYKSIGSKGKFTHIHTWPVSDDITLFNFIANFYKWLLVDAGFIIRSLEFQKIIDIYITCCHGTYICDANNNT